MTECPICKNRKQAKKELDNTEKEYGKFIRESRRTKNPITEEPGMSERLDECQCKPYQTVASIMVPHWKGKVMIREHYHTCPCGRRYPKEGTYDEDYSDNELY